MNLLKGFRGFALGAALACYGASGLAQGMSFPLGGVLGTAELATWVKNNMDEQQRAMHQLRSELASLKRELEEEKKLSLSLAQGFDKLSRQHRAELEALKQQQDGAQKNLSSTQAALAGLRQDHTTLEATLLRLQEQIAGMKTQLGRAPDGATR